MDSINTPRAGALSLSSFRLLFIVGAANGPFCAQWHRHYRAVRTHSQRPARAACRPRAASARAPAKLCDPVVTSRHFGPLLLAPSLRKRVHAAGAFPQRIDSVLPLIQRDAAQH